MERVNNNRDMEGNLLMLHAQCENPLLTFSSHILVTSLFSGVNHIEHMSSASASKDTSEGSFCRKET
jgi:hypothetical protein